MKSTIPDYFTALVKQHAGLLNDDQAGRVVIAVSEVLERVLTPSQESQFFALVPGYLRPHKQVFFSRIGTRAGAKQTALPATQQLARRLQLTSTEEAEVIFESYFMAIRTISDYPTAVKLTRILPADLARLYAHA